MEDQKTRINLSAKMTESEWQEKFDRLWLRATPEWFKWVTWCMIIGGVMYLREKTGDSALTAIYAILYAAFFFYLQSLFYSIEFEGIPWIRSHRAKRGVSLLLSAVLLMGVWWLLHELMTARRP